MVTCTLVHTRVSARSDPAEKVQELRDRFAELEKQIETLNSNLEALR